MFVNEEKTVNYPESITINGVTYAVRENPALLQFMQDVAKVEKNKLYSKFEVLNGELNKLKNVVVQPATIPTEDIVNSMKGNFVTKEDLETNLRSIVQEVVQPIVSQNEIARLEDLKSYREKLIAENDAVCMPELVKGNTKEELMQSLQESIELRKRYPSPFMAGTHPAAPAQRVTDPLIAQQMAQLAPAQATYTQTPMQQPVANVQPEIPSIPKREFGGYDQTPNVRQMSEEQFRSSYKSIEDSLRAVYG